MILLAVSLVLSLLFRLNLADYSCLYGWTFNQPNQTCTINCRHNVNCQAPILKPTLRLNTATDLSMPVGKSLGIENKDELPSCQLNTTSFCQQFSPQLLQCKLQMTAKGDYYIDGTTIWIKNSNFSAELGDYYIDQNNGSIYTCIYSVESSKNQVPRCNYVVLNVYDYVIMPNGSLRIPAANFVIRNARYSVAIHNMAFICVPSSFSFLNCPQNSLISTCSYVFSNTMKAVVYEYNKVLSLDEYYISKNGCLIACQYGNDVKNWATSTPFGDIMHYAYMTISFALFLTFLVIVVTHFRLLIINTHTLCVMQHMFSLMVYNVAISVSDGYFKPDNAIPCYAIFLFSCYFRMAVLLWLNVVIYDIWRIFTTYPNFYQIQRKSSKFGIRFRIYSLYSWGLSLAITLAILYADLSPICDFTYGFCPHIKYCCWFININALGIFFAIPIALTTTINFGFLASTIHSLRRIYAETTIAEKNRTKQLLQVSMKLFVVTGFSYATVLICGIIITINNDYYMYLSYVINGLFIIQAVNIFIIHYSRKLITVL
ncbi:hypothetical protein CHUAL_011923 [Chamberlinius hualienensis]